MGKIYKALGLMSGTSIDGIDVSIIESDGLREYSPILDKYYKYNEDLYKKTLEIRTKIFNADDLQKYSQEIQLLEKDITLFHAEVVNDIIKTSKLNIDLIGFHGQTVFHDSMKRITKQLGDGRLLSHLTKIPVVFNFRQNDIDCGGQGAPLVPIFHNLLANKINNEYGLEFPINVINIGGIANATISDGKKNVSPNLNLYACDIGPGNCLIDEWIRKNSNNEYDKDGLIARSGKLDTLILNQALENFGSKINYDKSLDIKDFDIFFAKGLTLENGAATITEFTAKLIVEGINYIQKKFNNRTNNWLVCGGGRKNVYLLERIKKNINNISNFSIIPIDKYKIDGDFVESQAFAYLSVRSIENLPISFPSTTRCNSPTTGGVLVKNF